MLFTIRAWFGRVGWLGLVSFMAGMITDRGRTREISMWVGWDDWVEYFWKLFL